MLNPRNMSGAALLDMFAAFERYAYTTGYQLPLGEPVLWICDKNLKLAVIQVLMYERHLLAPEFDVFDFIERYNGPGSDEMRDIVRAYDAIEDIPEDAYGPFPIIRTYFDWLPVPKALAKKVTEIYMDGGNAIYQNVAPYWDGEDGAFELTANDHLTDDLSLFPNLRKAIIMSNDYDRDAAIFEQLNVEVHPL